MSAIAAIFDSRTATGNGAAIGQMLGAMAHRGPHGAALHAAGPVALGHALLRTARAALHVAADGAAVSFDGRLDDRDALAARIGADPDRDDAVLVLAAYRRWGPACAAQLTGDFAYALWDARARRLVCTRDKFGVRPLLYADGAAADGRFLAASEAKALLAAGVSPEPDDAPLADMLAGLPPAPDRTPYRGIRRLPAGHSLIVDRGGTRLERYWTLPLPEPRTAADGADAFREALTQAVRWRMAGPQPIGAFLSGGLDSSSIVCLAAPMAPAGAPLRTFSIVYDRTPAHNERRFVEAVLARVRAEPTFIDAHRLAPFDDFDALLATHEGPINAPTIANTRLLHATAAAAGVRVLLDGHGGDEVVSFGLGRLTELAAAREWRSLWRELHALHRAEGGSALPAFAAAVRAFGPGRRLRGRLRRARPRTAPAYPFLDPDFVRRTQLAERHATPHRSPSGAAHTREAVQHHALLTGPLQPLALELQDRSAAAAGIELRFPFWDERLIACALSLDPADKLADGWTRRILRTAMDGVLPPEIQWRRDKLDFTPHLLRHIIDDDADGAVARILYDDRSAVAGYADLAAVRAAHTRLVHAHATRTACDGFDLQAVWRTVAVGLWLERRSGIRAWQEAAE